MMLNIGTFVQVQFKYLLMQLATCVWNQKLTLLMKTEFELNGTMHRILVRIGSALESCEYHSRVAVGEFSV